MIYPNIPEQDVEGSDEQTKTNVSEGEHADEMDGKMKQQNSQDKLMSSVMENDQETIDNGKLLADSLNQGIGSFTPDLMFESIVQNYKMAKQLYGETLLRAVSGYDPNYIQKNVQIPEFQRELKDKIKDRIEKLQDEDLLDKDGMLTDDGLHLASLVSYVEELDKLQPRGFYGEKVHKNKSHYGIGEETRSYRKGDRYRDISVLKTVKTSLRRGHNKIHADDLKVYMRESKSHIYVIYALDASGSMRGEKISLSKKAGIALAYKAIQEKDKVGLIVFGTDIKERVYPTDNFMELLKKMTNVRASMETNLKETISEAIKMFPNKEVTKHLILLTDAMPTTGKDPQSEVLAEVGNARNAGITISLVGINLDTKGKKLAEKIVEVGDGRLYVCKETDDIDQILLEDYYSL